MLGFGASNFPLSESQALDTSIENFLIECVVSQLNKNIFPFAYLGNKIKCWSS